ncbi:alpha/beta hydrolase fold domain-containing protein [Pseudactinotalea sp. HY160]|uniref:alpha/beta hydrolase n=1 Tax=Pseudactinotalea sp. HY160 TaxID=2654490 RepID=UPI0013112EE1|nr:alpha/beta hydrolase [Pseudactinotalea sp. HY160]MPV49680.1 alpha/beta hydrolase fold domain-containing protein [Pseudactinotalea sp. HY160]
MRRGWVLGGLAAAVATAAVAYEASPWPRVWLLRFFAGDGSDPVSATAPHIQPGLEQRLDLRYDDSRPECLLDVYQHEGTRPLPALIWVHGGGFVTGAKEPLRPYLSVVASHGFTTVNLDYTPAPEALHPDQVHQLGRAVQYVVDHAAELDIDPDQLVLGGDSAGAHIVAQAVLASLDREYAAGAGITEFLDPARIVGVALASGPFDPAAAMAVRGPFRWYLRTVLWAYSGSRSFANDPEFAYSSITPHVHADFPPAFLTSGPRDPLAVQSHALAARLREVGGDVDEVVLEETSRSGHVFDFDLGSSDARLALGRLVAFLRRVTTTPHRHGASDAW